MCESSTAFLRRGLLQLPAIWRQWGRIQEGIDFLKILARGNVPYRFGWAITAAHGVERVSKVTLGKLNNDSQPTSQSENIQDVDTVVIGYGLTPSTELCRQLDCDFEFDEFRGGFIPLRSDDMQTSCPGVYAVGDGAGLGGAEMAMIEGRIAGYATAIQLGHMAERLAGEMIARENSTIRREQRFAQMLGALFSPPVGLYTLAESDTIICRCEQVKLAEIRKAISYGAQTINDVKNLVRTGMGNCQGRTCGSITTHILAAETGKTLEEVRYFNIRPPIHPLPLSVIEEFGKDSDYMLGEIEHHEQE